MHYSLMKDLRSPAKNPVYLCLTHTSPNLIMEPFFFFFAISSLESILSLLLEGSQALSRKRG